MRRALGLIIVGTLLIPAIAATAQNTDDYRDDFGDGAYGGSDGSLDWPTSWSEDGTDDGSASSGSIHIGSENCSNNECLHMESGLLGSLRVRRAADLSMFEKARLSFDMYIESSLISTGVLDIQVRGGGVAWRSLDSYLLNVAGGEHDVSLDVTDFISSDFELRFRITQLLSGDVYFDRVNIEGELAVTSTTSSTTTSTSLTSSSTSSTTSTSTTSTSSTSTTSSIPTDSTNTSLPAPTTTLPGQADRAVDPETSTTVARPTTPTSADPSGAETATTTTEPGESTTTTLAPVAILGPFPPVGGGGLRDPGVGLISDYATGMMGRMSMERVEVLGAELDADFSMAVEVFEAVKVWGAVLALMVATAVVGGVERRKYRLTRHM